MNETGAPSNPPDRVYDLDGIVLAVTADAAEAAGCLDPILAPLRCAPDRAADWQVSIASASVIEPPDHGHVLFAGPLPEGWPATMVVIADERHFIVPGHLAMHFQRSVRRTYIRYQPGQEATLRGTAALWLLEDMLAAMGRHLLHGALLVDLAVDRAVAIFAPSGTGKTTTALALARSGFALGGDDAMILNFAGDGGGAWALPRMAKIHRRTAALLDWLAPLLSQTWHDDEQALDLTALAPALALAGPRRRPIALVVILMPPNATGHRKSPIAKPEALAILASDNLRLGPGGVDADNAATMAALARLVMETPVVALSVGPNPASLDVALLDTDRL